MGKITTTMVLEDSLIQWIEDFKQKTGATTRSEVIRNALHVYQHIASYAEQGYSMEMVNGEKREKIMFLELQRLYSSI